MAEEQGGRTRRNRYHLRLYIFHLLSVAFVALVFYYRSDDFFLTFLPFYIIGGFVLFCFVFKALWLHWYFCCFIISFAILPNLAHRNMSDMKLTLDSDIPKGTFRFVSYIN